VSTVAGDAEFAFFAYIGLSTLRTASASISTSRGIKTALVDDAVAVIVEVIAFLRARTTRQGGVARLCV